MPPLALGMTLLAAFMHASWNLLLRRTVDTQVTTALMLCTGCLVLAPLAALDWSLDGAVLPYLLASTVLQTAYFVLLATAYGRAELSLIYPLARGTAPVIVLVVAVGLLGLHATPVEGLGVVLVGGGVLLVRGLHGTADPQATGLALLIALTIAGYTLIDRVGVTLANPLAYLEVETLGPGLAYLVVVTRLRGIRQVRASFSVQTAVAGVLSVGAYGLVLLALRIAPAPSVAAVRESGVVMATAMSAWLLHERVTRERFAGAALVVAGIAALALA